MRERERPRAPACTGLTSSFPLYDVSLSRRHTVKIADTLESLAMCYAAQKNGNIVAMLKQSDLTKISMEYLKTFYNLKRNV